MSDDLDLTPTRWHQFLLKCGERFGLRWLPFSKAAFIMHDENFLRMVRGPKFFWLVPSKQRILFTLTLLPDSFEFMIDKIHSSDGLDFQFFLDIGYRFDPLKLPVEGGIQPRIAATYRKREDRQREIMAQTQRALQLISSEYAGADLVRNAVWVAIESKLFQLLEKRLAAFGMSLMLEKCKIMNITPPELLSKRLEIAAQRAENIHALNQFTSQEIASALRSEAIEALKDMSKGNPYLNMNELAEPSSKDGAAPKPRIIDGKATPSAKPPIAPSPDDPTESGPPKKKPRSRL